MAHRGPDDDPRTIKTGNMVGGMGFRDALLLTGRIKNENQGYWRRIHNVAIGPRHI